MKTDVVDMLFQKYYNDVLLYALSLTRNTTLAEEAVSTTFFKALRSRDEVLNFKSWLMRVCRNVCFDLLKKRNRFVSIDETTIDESEHAIDKIIRDERYKALHHAIELLADAQKEVILLHYFENFRIKDISLIVGKTEDNVKVLLYRARENLKKILEE